MNNTIKRIKNNPNIKVVFTDLFDTLIHRVVHPHYPYRIWAKFMINELGMDVDIDTLYRIRICAADTLAEDLALSKVELPYDIFIKEVYNRLVNTNVRINCGFEKFDAYFQEADFKAESSVQFINQELVDGLIQLKKENYKIYAVSDFHVSRELIERLLSYHGILNIFDDIFISCDYKKSKETGSLYPFVLSETNSIAKETAMMGDNMRSDVVNANKYDLNANFLKHRTHKFRNKKNLFGSVQKEFLRVCKQVERSCKKSDHPFSEYILHYYFFTERLYLEAKRKGIKDLFFLAREGLYLKQIFDTYQEINGLMESDAINTHYFKASRHSAMQVSLEPIETEEFGHLKKKYDHMSVEQFLQSFDIADADIDAISSDLNIKKDEVVDEFISSEYMVRLRTNERFVTNYDKHRIQQKTAFDNYLKSFNVDFNADGMVLVDVGWGGTMQECIYKYMEGKVHVTGYYIGLTQIYDIQKETKRFGLNFRIYPKSGFSDEILRANGQLYEQMLAAPHGSTTGYSLDKDTPTLEFHEPNEKRVFDEFVEPVQDFMNVKFKELCIRLGRTTYTDQMVQDYITDLALRLGLWADRKKMKFVQLISQGFYQNMGENKVGLVYDPSQLKISKLTLLKQFIWNPEKTFRYLVKIKPLLYSKNLFWLLGGIVSLSFYHIKLNRWFKRNFFDKKLI